MTDDPTRGDGLDGADVADDEDGEDERPVVVLNPALDRVTGRRVFGIAAVLGGAVLVGAVIYGFITLYGQDGPSKGLEGVVLLVAGFVTVALLLYLGTLILRALDMGAPGEALGMPEGSIRALIAMSLILIFAIIGIQVFAAGSAGTVLESTGLTQVQIDALRADGAIVVSQTLLTPVPAPPAAALYDVATRQVMTQEAHDFGLQLMTTVSTLVVAVAGFYFGSRAVSQATTTVSEQLRLSRSYSRRGVIGTKPEPGVETEEAPGEVIENELGSTEETDEDVEQEPPNDDDSEDGAVGGGDAGDGGDGPDLDDDDAEPRRDHRRRDGRRTACRSSPRSHRSSPASRRRACSRNRRYLVGITRRCPGRISPGSEPISLRLAAIL